MSDGTDWCRHYRGVSKTCDAGVEPREVMVTFPSTGIHGERTHRYPCFEDDHVPYACAQCSYLTPAERQAQKEASARVWTEYLTNIANDVCPICKGAIVRRKQVGRCVYASPCGHRLYQGKA